MKIVRYDLAGLEADALINSACGEVRVGAGVDSAIYARGGKELWVRRQAVGAIGEGEVVATEAGGSLACRVVVHAVVPEWKGGAMGEEAALRGCYRRAADAARAKGCRTAAFPLLGAGHKGFPAEVALKAAVEELEAEEDREDGLECTLALYPGAVARLAGQLFGEVRDLLDSRFSTDEAVARSVEDACAELGTSVRDVRGGEWLLRRSFKRAKSWLEDEEPSCAMRASLPAPMAAEAAMALPPELAAKLKAVGSGVGKALMALMNRKHFDNRKLMVKTGISKQLLSKIQNGKHAKAPDKRWLLAVSVAMGLTLEETRGFLATAGYALSESNPRDVVVAYFLGRGGAQIGMVDAALACLGQETLYPEG